MGSVLYDRDTNQTETIMGKVKEQATQQAEELALEMNISLGAAMTIVMEGVDYADTPPELGMAGDYEDHDAETGEVLKHIVKE
jgi:hypothetical protein